MTGFLVYISKLFKGRLPTMIGIMFKRIQTVIGFRPGQEDVGLMGYYQGELTN